MTSLIEEMAVALHEADRRGRRPLRWRMTPAVWTRFRMGRGHIDRPDPEFLGLPIVVTTHYELHEYWGLETEDGLPLADLAAGDYSEPCSRSESGKTKD